MDSKDEFATHQYSFAGLDNILIQFGQQLSGALGIPLVKLFGQSPAGFNATGESDLSNYYDGINQSQEGRLRTPLNILLEVISMSKLGKPLPSSFKFDFASLWQIDDETKANVADKVSTAVSRAVEDGLISRQTALKELRQSSEVTNIFSHITDEEIDQAEDDPPPPSEMTNEKPTDTDQPPSSEEGGDTVQPAASKDSVLH
ncbi:HI1409 family phage-associated protein [Acinetobacter nectaris CIP 110549]|uniref:HI1409 family phage-associated protein n=1 Tax=Acinetobacter nectaris CIP 110549 TaxID=1392540 RepID=V2TXA8_9GAMM|nr:HI1409 family phage-associated protein [Acinetobacter nectaris CIP 110549]